MDAHQLRVPGPRYEIYRKQSVREGDGSNFVVAVPLPSTTMLREGNDEAQRQSSLQWLVCCPSVVAIRLLIRTKT